MPHVGVSTAFKRGSVTLGGVHKVEHDGPTRESFDVTPLNVSTTTSTTTIGNAEFIPSGVVDAGTINVELFLERTVVLETCAWETAQSYSFVGPGGTRTFSAFCVSVGQSIQVDDVIKQTMELKCTGPVTLSTATT